MMVTAEGDGRVLGIGIDWAEELHDVAVGTPEKGVIEQFRIEHRSVGVAALVGGAAAGAGPGRGSGGVGDPARAAGRGAARRRVHRGAGQPGPGHPQGAAQARKKDDAEDARICCLLALDRHAGLRALVPHGELGGELRAIARDDERAARDQRRLLNRLRADLQTVGRHSG